MTTRPVALITGCSSGFGLESALHLTRKGYTVVATMRDLARRAALDDRAKVAGVTVEVLRLDVTDEASVRDAVAATLAKYRRIDALVNNAGYGVLGTVEETSLDEWKAQYEANIFGLIRVTQEVLPVMRAQKSGRIIHIGSIGGRLSAPYFSVYQSTKHSLEAINEAMRHEIAGFGLQCTLIEPGGSPTKFVDSMVIARKMKDPASAYAALNARMLSLLEKFRAVGFPPSQVARTIERALRARHMRRRYLVGTDAKLLAFLRNFVPDALWDAAERRLYRM
ncbi:MAG: SDR family oxidoreductase [bacterium]